MNRSWSDVFKRATEQGRSEDGYYNHNFLVPCEGDQLNIRIPLSNVESMDLRLWREDEILPVVSERIPHVPKLLHASIDPVYLVLEYIPGDILADLAPDGDAVPEHVLHDVVGLLRGLSQIDVAELPACSPDWPRDGDIRGFAEHLSAFTRGLYRRFQSTHGSLYDAFGFPEDPLSSVDEQWAGLRKRPLRLIHADIHRKNMIVSHGVTSFIDWELALLGDPVYEFALHMHRMCYPPAQCDRLKQEWVAWMDPDLTVGYADDISAYVAHEKVKSSIVDTVRCSERFAAGFPDGETGQAVDLLVRKLNAACEVWGRGPEHTALSTRDILTAWCRGN